MKGFGIKEHMKAIKEVYLKDGVPQIKYKSLNGSPGKTSCGIMALNNCTPVNAMDFAKIPIEHRCSKCQTKLKSIVAEAENLKNKQIA